jgi:hypothetical protein
MDYFVINSDKMQDIKTELHQMIEQIEDDKVLEAIYTLLSIQPVAYTTSGNPVDATAYDQMIEEGEKDIQEGKVYSHAEVKSHFKQKVNE